MKRLALALTLLAACNLYLDARSPAPPGREARLEAVQGFWGIVGYRAELSHGVALAVACVDSPCAHVHATSDDSAIAEVRPVALNDLEHASWSDSAQRPGAFVVVGKTPGATMIHVVDGKRHRDVPVTVIAPPTPHDQQVR